MGNPNEDFVKEVLSKSVKMVTPKTPISIDELKDFEDGSESESDGENDDDDENEQSEESEKQTMDVDRGEHKKQDDDGWEVVGKGKGRKS